MFEEALKKRVLKKDSNQSENGDGSKKPREGSLITLGPRNFFSVSLKACELGMWEVNEGNSGLNKSSAKFNE